MSESTEEYDETVLVEEVADVALRVSRPPGWLALVSLAGVTGAAVAGLIYAIILDGDPGALQSLSNIALLGVGSLAALLGHKGGTG